MRTKYVKRIVCVVALVFAVNPLLFAQDNSDKSKGSDMTGTLCDQKCVKQDADKASCDLGCKEKSGEAAFIDDHGKLWKVANPAVCKGHMGKKVKLNCRKMEDKEDTMWINSIYG